MKRIGIITSGGDCGGLNAVVKGTAQMANRLGVLPYIIPNGYAGLYNLIEFDHLVEVTEFRADEIGSNLAGSEAGHSRVKIKKIDDDQKYERIVKGLKKFEIDALVISGGDDTGSVIIDLLDHGIKCIHAPKTMDLDLQTYSVGADSTISRISYFAEELKTTATTHNRIMVMEVFGRYAGHTAFRGGVAAEADAILIPEVPVNFDIVYAHMKQRYFQRVLKDDVHAGSYMVIVAEGLKNADGSEIVDESLGVDSFGHKILAGAGKYVQQQLTKRLKADPEIADLMKKAGMFVKGLYETPEVREVRPGHLVRCGHSSAYDVNFGKEAGAAAVQLLVNGISGVTIVGIDGKAIRYMDTKEAIKQRHVDLDQVAVHENMGTCFGRDVAELKPKFEKVTGKVTRHL
jgi:6-phosphofructokinase 1